MLNNRTIANPRIPFIGPIRGVASAEKCIQIRACAPNTANRFNISLQCGPATTPEYDIALRITVHMIGGYITLNSLDTGVWGKDQRGILPIKHSEEFEIVIIYHFFNFTVIIDGQHYADFRPRVSSDSITHLAINGNVSVSEISYQPVSSGYENRTVSGHRLASQLSARENNRGDFSLVTTSSIASSNEEIYPPPFSDSSPPPSYEAAIESSNRAPYPTSDPIGMPLVPINANTDLILHSPPITSGIPSLPSHTIGIYEPFECIVTPPAADVGAVPLNRNNSAFRRSADVKSKIFSRGRCAISIGIVTAIILLIKFVL